MQYIIFSLFCSVSVGILLRFSKNFPVSTMQIINWNYVFAGILCYFLFKPNIVALPLEQLPWLLIVFLWFVLPTLFLIQALSLKYVGVAKTDVAQRLSLFLTLVVAFLFLKEQLNNYKLIGLSIALVSIYLTLHRGAAARGTSNSKIIYPIVVFIGFALVDVLFKLVATQKTIDFTTLLFMAFCGAFIVALGINMVLIFKGKQRFSCYAAVWGLGLGLLNFGNIYFYIKAHQAIPDNPSIVFATMNIGVVALGCLAGVVIFKEKLTKLNFLGIALAIVAVAVLTAS